ncbi:hypothetical protein Nepgr_029238 [Nepenthes gracilis]|uniref:Protein TIFY n=1 Tax=Nepenthes gracilis TaxID=150966 RepID=A0AAD3TC31_NEPGR|nr:hypothetical protein Nepgr_029238 [Nepenthes gracilis]
MPSCSSPNLEHKMSRAQVEHDFFSAEESSFRPHLERRRSFREIQHAISKISPEVLKSVIASGSATKSSENGGSAAPNNSVPASPNREQILLPSLPAPNQFFQPSCGKSPETAPMTIFYNGMVCVYDVPRDTAESIFKFAKEGSLKNGGVEVHDTAAPSRKGDLLGALNGDFPITRRKSVQRFFEKRKERLISASPYY